MKNDTFIKKIKPLWKLLMRPLLRIYSSHYNLFIYNDLSKNTLGKAYSQFGQDTFVLKNVFNGMKNGVFVDVGANHPTHGSNTYLLEENGWTGLAIEPQEKLRSLWPSVRKTRCLKYVVGSENKKVVFVEGTDDEHGLSGVEGFNKCKEGCKKVTLEQKRLDDILTENNIRHVDYLSIDVEGYEMSVLESIDLSKSDIKLIGLENDQGFENIPFVGKKLGSELGNNKIREYLEDRGYRYIARIFCDDFFIKTSMKNSLFINANKAIFKLKSYIKPVARSIKSKKIRQLFLRMNGKITEYSFKKTILKYYDSLNPDEIDAEKKEVLEYLRSNPATLFPYEFTKKYKASDIKVFTDDKKGLKYVLWDDKKLYFKRSCAEKEIKELASSLFAVQDEKSPHRYLVPTFNASKDDIVADIGAAEGDFALSVVEKAKKVYLFESDPELIEALEATFEPWKKKVVIVSKYVSDKTTGNHTTLDHFFKDKELPTFLKIDVEGAELNLLHGAEQLLSNKGHMKIVIASYHKHNDEIVLRDELEKYDFKTEYSKGYMLSIWDGVLKEPYLRRGLIRAVK
ncbi:MAG: FkbM family methyltransferase [Candidatus Paceibacterota bacterium]|jgi:FkbM family methyltransferase